MVLDSKAANEITEADLQSLIDDGIGEGTTIDYKESLYGSADEDKREFLFDVSSFANAAGGYLILGVKEEGGLPTDLVGLENLDADDVKLRFENMLRDSMKPRIPGVTMAEVPLKNGRDAFALHIPKSFAGPHMVEFKKHVWFYSRNSAGKYRLDVDQLRAAFVQSETMADRIRLFRLERLGVIVAEETPVPLWSSGKTVIHVVPLAATDPLRQMHVSMMAENKTHLVPYDDLHARQVTRTRYNLDGFVSFVEPDDSSPSFGYLQAFRNGSIESVDALFLRDEDGGRRVFAWDIEEHVIEVVGRVTKFYRQVGVNSPIVVLLSLTGVRGYVLPKPSRFIVHPWEKSHPIDRDVLLIPEVIVENLTDRPAEYMRPAFDALWNAAGWPRSLNYDEQGQRQQ